MSDTTVEQLPAGNKVTKVLIEELMKENYIDYSMSVIVGRALPDARDGFKPVHRRVLYSMEELGVGHNKPHKKAARIVGQCFIPGTLVITDTGLKPIESLRKGDLVRTHKGLQPVTELYEMPERELISVSSENSNVNISTTEQEYYVFTPELKFIWKKACELKAGDYMVQRLSEPPEQVWSDEAYFLGLLLSNGWVSVPDGRVGISSGDENVINNACKIIAKLFDRTVVPVQDGNVWKTRFPITSCKWFLDKYDLYSKKSITAHIPQALFSQHLNFGAFLSGYMDGDGHVAKNKKRMVISTSSPDMVRDIVAMLNYTSINTHVYTLDQDNGFKSNNTGYAIEMYGTDYSKLKSLLGLFHSYRRDNLDNSKITMGEINEYITSVNNATGTGVIPFLGPLIMAEFSRKHLGSGWYDNGTGVKVKSGLRYKDGTKFRYGAGSKEAFTLYNGHIDGSSLTFYEKMVAINSEYLPLIDEIKTLGYRFTEIKEIKSAGVGITYDIQVDGDHSFIANGVIVHNCMGLYHPHGDSSIYGTLVRMAQPWSLNHTLVDGQGNFGSPAGDPPAAMRYTEARLTKLAGTMFKEIKHDTVDWISTFDDSGLEPSVLPVQFPQLLVNGTTGIAVGMGTNILPHNLREVIAATIAIIDNPEISDDEILEFIPAPDFPTGGIIYGLSGVRPGMLNGEKGRVTLRGEYHIEERGQKELMVFTSLPYTQSTDDIATLIADLVRSGKIEGITDVNDESNKDGIRLVIELRKDATPQVVANHLYKQTGLQQHFPINNTALIDGRPKVFSVPALIKTWIQFRYDVTKKRISFDIAQLTKKLELLDGYVIVLSKIDAAIKIIKGSKNTAEAKEQLMAKFKLTETQAKHVLELRLSKLTSMEIESIKEEQASVKAELVKLDTILNSDQLIYEDIKTILVQIGEEFGVDRITKIEHSELDVDLEEFIEKKDVIITCSGNGYVKRTAADVYRTQTRGGQGKLVAKTKEDDHIASIFYCNTHTFLFAFTDNGKCYYTRAYHIPETDRTGKGRPIQNFLNTLPGEKIICMATSDTFDDKILFICSKNRVAKKMDLKLMINAKRRGVNAVTIEEGDELMGALILNPNDTILVADANGQVVRFHDSSFRNMGRGAAGNYVMDTEAELVSMIACGDDNKYLITVSTEGLGKKTPINQYRITTRNNKGIATMKRTDRTGALLGIMLATNEDDVMISCKSGKSIRFSVDDVREIGRETQGVKLVDMAEGDEITDFIVIPN